MRLNAGEVLKENSRWGVWRTIAGYEAIHMIRKARRAEVCWVQKSVSYIGLSSACLLRLSYIPDLLLKPLARLQSDNTARSDAL